MAGWTLVNPFRSTWGFVKPSSLFNCARQPAPESAQPLFLLGKLILLIYIHCDLFTAAVVWAYFAQVTYLPVGGFMLGCWCVFVSCLDVVCCTAIPPSCTLL